jgi:hypothetical protein
MKYTILAITLLFSFFARAQSDKNANVIIITLDGLRWQEVFGGLDEEILADKTYTSDSASLRKAFWASTPEERRKKLLPFLWSTVSQQGQLHGNRHVGSKVNVKNRYWFSYPGYNEIFTGYPDTLVNSNDKNLNKNKTVLEYLHEQAPLKNKIAAFTSWNVFDAIFNEPRSKFPVSSGFDPVAQSSATFALLNDMQRHSYKPFGDDVRPDMLTYYTAKEYLKAKQPRVLYIAFDETDDYAHGGKYDQYIKSAHLTDHWIGDLWQTLQAMPQYRNNTTLIVTTDHGRGDAVKKEWTSHGAKIIGADQIWMAFLGKGVESVGEIRKDEQLYQAQLAQTIAGLLGYRYAALHPVEKGITTLGSKE